MRKLINLLVFFFLFVKPAGSEVIVKADDCASIDVKVSARLALPRWYHEGLFFDGKNIWVCNGKEGMIWVVDTASGKIISEISPVAGFTEAITKQSDGIYFTTDWDEKKLYKARIGNDRIIPLFETSFAPAHPAGVIWARDRLYVITWTRGMGTRFDLIEIGSDMKQTKKIRIKDIQEPSQMAWDGKNLWITSWFHRLIYKIDIRTFKVIGRFVSPVDKTTGIAWDGKHMWVTGTASDLYKLELIK